MEHVYSEIYYLKQYKKKKVLGIKGKKSPIKQIK